MGENYGEKDVAGEVDEDTGVVGGPVFDDGCLFDGQVDARPGEVAEHLCDLLVSAELAGEKLAGAQGKGDGRD